MIVIINYGLGNLGSVKNALDKLGVDSMVSNKPTDIERADGLILPGVGAAGEGMKNLREREIDVVIKNEVKKGKSLLGICLGMQLLMTKSEEGNEECLNIIKGSVKKFKTKLKIPQIGWNTVQANDSSLLFRGIPQNSYFYFVHSYYCAPSEINKSGATTQYGEVFSSVVRRENVFGVQFHPEKSGSGGLQLLKNFTNIIYENNTSN